MNPIGFWNFWFNEKPVIIFGFDIGSMSNFALLFWTVFICRYLYNRLKLLL